MIIEERVCLLDAHARRTGGERARSLEAMSALFNN